MTRIGRLPASCRAVPAQPVCALRGVCCAARSRPGAWLGGSVSRLEQCWVVEQPGVVAGDGQEGVCCKVAEQVVVEQVL